MKSHLDKLRFRHLVLVETLGSTRSLRKASELLSMTQPGCSKLLRELEQELGAVLFERRASGVSPTPYGEVMIRTAHLILAQANSALEEMETLADGAHVRIRVGMFGVALASFVADVVKRMREVASRSVISLEEGSAELLLGALSKGDIDCVVGRGNQTVKLQGLRQIPLFFEAVALVGRQGHPLARRKNLALKDVAALDWVLPAQGTVLRQRVESMFAQHRLAMPNCQIESSVYATNQALLPLGDQVTLFPLRLAKGLADTGSLSILQLPLELELPPVSLWLRNAFALPPALETFVREVRTVSAKWT